MLKPCVNIGALFKKAQICVISVLVILTQSVRITNTIAFCLLV